VIVEELLRDLFKGVAQHFGAALAKSNQ